MLKSSNTVFYILLIIGVIGISGYSNGQADDYFFPIRPGQQNFLSGTMGELRSSHFHAGIDIKTGGVEGLPVYAAQDGYISRIKISGGGYGNVLYVAHPKFGTTTVYGHLQQFGEEIAKYVRKEQYRTEKFAIELFPASHDFPVKKGDIIALSGNSGSSGGPHLHFEIRDSYQRPLNPLKQGFSEIRDNIPPTVRKVALKTLNKDSRIDGQFGTFQYSPFLSQKTYKLSKPIEVFGEIGIMVMAHDRLNGASNKNGLSSLTLEVDGQPVMGIEIDKIPFSKGREILVYRDNELRETYNRSFQKLYIDDGNELDFYTLNVRDGKLSIRDGQSHEVRIILKDASSNSSEVRFTLNGSLEAPDTTFVTSRFKPTQYRVMDNTLVFMTRSKESTDLPAKIIANRIAHKILPAYTVNQHDVYLWDLRKGLPDSILIDSIMIKPLLEMMVPSKSRFNYYKRHMDVYFSSPSLFDTIYLKTDYMPDLDAKNEYFELGDPSIPLRKHLKVILRPTNPYPYRDKTSVYHTSNFRNFTYQGGQWKGNNIEFRTRNFGKFTLLTDTIPPKVKIIEQNRARFRCYISDDLSGISNFELEINGKWVLLNYDPKRKYCWSEKLDGSKPFKGDLKLTVTDHVNNVHTYISNIK
jgi:hypothetical protein